MVTATEKTKRSAVSSSTRGNKVNNSKGASRSNVSSRPGKSGQVPAASKAKAGAQAQQSRDIPKPTLKEMKSLHALGVSMTNIHRIVQQKPGLKSVRYYDVWKALRSE